MSSYHFYEAKNKDTDEIFEILKNFEKEVEEFEKWADQLNDLIDPEAGPYGIDTNKLSN